MIDIVKYKGDHYLAQYHESDMNKVSDWNKESDVIMNSLALSEDDRWQRPSA